MNQQAVGHVMEFGLGWGMLITAMMALAVMRWCVFGMVQQPRLKQLPERTW